MTTHKTDRGFHVADPITTRLGMVRVGESSLATAPELWLTVTDAAADDAETSTALSAEQARQLRDDLHELLRQHDHGDQSEPDHRRPTLGGRIDGTGAWCVDDLEPPDGVNVVTMHDPPRPALRDPDGGAWASWMALPALAGLRAQLDAGAAVMVDPETYEPDDIDRAVMQHITDLLKALVCAGDDTAASAAHRVARLASVIARAAAHQTPAG